MQRTNWYVITGAPCSGKTAVICALEQMGCQVVHEVARAYIDKELGKGKSIAQIKLTYYYLSAIFCIKRLKLKILFLKMRRFFLIARFRTALDTICWKD